MKKHLLLTLLVPLSLQITSCTPDKSYLLPGEYISSKSESENYTFKFNVTNIQGTDFESYEGKNVYYDKKQDYYYRFTLTRISETDKSETVIDLLNIKYDKKTGIFQTSDKIKIQCFNKSPKFSIPADNLIYKISTVTEGLLIPQSNSQQTVLFYI